MPKLFSPAKVGRYELRNRIVLPPLTRNRATEDFVPTPRMTAYYAQRASAGLIIAEGTAISPQAVGYPRVPGIWNDEQVCAWRAVTDAVHAEGGCIFVQLWHVGRVSHSLTQPGGQRPVAPSPVAVPDDTIVTPEGLREFEVPRALTTEEVCSVVDDYAQAATNAVRAGFDGVEIHAANGYLIDQFLNDNINMRDDEYGGPVSARVRFLLEVADAVSAAVGVDRVGVRLSPSGTFMGCHDSNRRAVYGAAVAALAERPLAYLHLIEPTIAGNVTVDAAPDAMPSSYFRRLFPGTLIVAGDHTFESGSRVIAAGEADLVGYGRAFISNPDLPLRFAVGAPLTTPDLDTFYTDGDEGYVDYVTLDEEPLEA
jgi:N-ethylmaleimide reductase